MKQYHEMTQDELQTVLNELDVKIQTLLDIPIEDRQDNELAAEEYFALTYDRKEIILIFENYYGYNPDNLCKTAE